MAREREVVSLGDICDFRAGTTFRPSFQGQLSGRYPFVKVSDMNLPANTVRIQDANNWVSEADVRELRAKPFPPKTVVFAKIGEALRQNRLRQVVRETIIDNNMMGAIPRGNRVDPDFFYYALSQFDFSDIAQGTALPYLTLPSLARLTLAIPCIDEQRAIASILGALDDKIELNRQTNETLEAMARALFKSWFIDFDPVHAKAEGRDPGLPADVAALFPDSFQDSELGKIPHTWRGATIGAELTTVLGGTPSRGEAEYWEGGTIPWVNSSKANEFRVTEPSEFITRKGLESSATKLLPERTTIVAITGATLGKVSLLEIEACANQSIVGILGSNRLPSEFIYCWVKEHIDSLVSWQTGGAQQHINKDNINHLSVLCPSGSTIREFVRTIRPVFDRIKGTCLESHTLAALRDTLLPELLSGELRVREAEQALG